MGTESEGEKWKSTLCILNMFFLDFFGPFEDFLQLRFFEHVECVPNGMLIARGGGILKPSDWLGQQTTWVFATSKRF